MIAALVCAAVLSSGPAEAPLWSAQPEAPRVGEIVFEGAPAESVRALVEVQVGAPLDARDVRDAVRALHASARFSRVAAYLEPMDDGRVRLVFVLAGVEKL
ncbi:MAG: POTRA domain-containing protein, partial [Myxococcales bacterium]